MAVIAQGSFQEGGAVLFLLGGGCPAREVVEVLRGDTLLSQPWNPKIPWPHSVFDCWQMTSRVIAIYVQPQYP